MIISDFLIILRGTHDLIFSSFLCSSIIDVMQIRLSPPRQGVRQHHHGEPGGLFHSVEAGRSPPTDRP